MYKYQFWLTDQFEHNISKALERKSHWYADLIFDISRNGYNCNHTCIENGSRGLITPETNKRISEISSSIKAEPPKSSLKKDLSKIAIFSSYTICMECTPRTILGDRRTSPPTAIALSLFLICMLFALIIYCWFGFVFCQALYRIMVTFMLMAMVHDLGLCVHLFVCSIFVCLYI